MTIKVGWQQIPAVQVTIAMAKMGFDWIVVDLEHSSITTQEAESIFIAAERCAAKPFVRLPNAAPYLARRLLDAGAQGLLVPVTESLAEFDEFAIHCFFPPKGKRGLGLVRANEWGNKLDSYYSCFKPTLIAQIETQKGAVNIADILSSSFLDGIMIGPYDLTASMGKPGQFEDVEYNSLRLDIINKARKSHKLVGFHQVEPNLSKLDQCITDGYDFVAYGTDIVAMRFALQGVNE